MTNAYYTSPTDVEAGVKVRSTDINTIDAAIDSAFDKLPTENNLKRGTTNYAVDTGAANAYVVSLPHTPSGYVDGLTVRFRAINTNTGASTINVNSLGTKSIRNRSGSALAAGDITVGVPLEVIYSTSTGFFHLSENSAVSATAAASSATAAASSASAASTSASAASSSATAAASSASAASTSETNAASSASSASTSATTATTQASNASTSATNAASSATTATTKASEASTSATNAATSASAASTSATNASNSASAAATSATNASNSASSASTSATNAANSATAAATSETNAGTSATNAATSATAADSAAQAVTVKWAFDSSTTMGDPGTGDLRLNNATIASVTAIAVSASSSASGNPDVSDFVVTWDDSTTSTSRGTIILRKSGTPATFAVFSVNGSITDNGTWLQIPVAHVASNGTLSNADALYVGFQRTGDQGGGGDTSSNTATSVNNEIALFSGTSGKTIKRASTTGILKASSGVIAAAVAGTDYASAGSITSSGLTQATARLLGRTTASTGAIEEISVSGATLSGGALTITQPSASTGASLTLLATLTPTAAATLDALTTFTSSYDNYLIIGQGLLPSANDSIMMRFAAAGAADTGSNYYDSSVGGSDSVAGATMTLTGSVFSTGKGCSFTLRVFNANDAVNAKQVLSEHVRQSDGTPTWLAGQNLGSYIAANAITGIRFYWAGGNNFQATGKIRIYGYNNS